MTFDAWWFHCEERSDEAISSGMVFVRVIEKNFA
jgi:hypothetical protein